MLQLHSSSCVAICFGLLLVASLCVSTEDAKVNGGNEKEGDKGKEVDPEYAKVSLCGYCKYCKFCRLCKTDCPCTDQSRVGCDMCKYCKYCTLCSVCDTFCKSGGFLDSVMSRLLGSVDTEKVDKELDNIKEYL